MKQAVGIGQEPLAIGRQNQLSTPPYEECRPEARLQLFDARRDIRLDTMEARGRFGDPALLGDGLEDLEGGQINRSHFENYLILIIHFSQRGSGRTLRAWCTSLWPVWSPSLSRWASVGLPSHRCCR